MTTSKSRPSRPSRAVRVRLDPTVLQLALDAAIAARGLPTPEPEFRFARAIKRQWRIDRAWPAPQWRIALEIEGGVYVPGGGAHQRTGRGGRYLSDMEKYNQLALWGWLLIRVTYDMIADGRALDLLTEAFAFRRAQEQTA